MNNHSFDVDVATQYGVNAAIIFQDMGYWCEHSRMNRKNFHDDRYWTFNSISALGEHYPYFSAKTIRLAIQKLVDAGLLVTGTYNSLPFDRTTWYALTEEGEKLWQKGSIEFPKRANENFPKGQMRISQKGKPIPNTYTHTNTIIDEEEERAREEIDINPYGDTNYVPPKDTVQQYAVNNMSTMGYRAMQELASFVEDLNEDIVRHAIDNALDNGVTKWSYVRAILNEYCDAHVKTVGEAKVVDEKRRKQKAQKTQKSEQSTKPAEEMTQEEMDYAMRHGPFGKFY